jgi:hypothetical protein
VLESECAKGEIWMIKDVHGMVLSLVIVDVCHRELSSWDSCLRCYMSDMSGI